MIEASTTLPLRILYIQRPTNSAMGTPQVRWREMHQSGLLPSMASMRARPQSGYQATFATSAQAASSRPSSCVPRSRIPMNHCGVARKMRGVLVRQQCG